jgi:hypothetical protein
VFYWLRAYHVRVTKLGCLPRNSARGKQYVIDRRITKKNHVRHHVKMRPLDMPTHVKISHLVTSQQTVNKMYSHCLSQVVNRFGTTCNNLVDIIKLVARLFWQDLYCTVLYCTVLYCTVLYCTVVQVLSDLYCSCQTCIVVYLVISSM